MGEIDSRIESLRERLQPIVRTWLHVVTDDLGLRVKITETLRSAARQEQIRASGASPLGYGWHNVGLAWDFACFDERGVYLGDGTDPRYRQAGRAAEALGCVWGGSWQHPDYDHCEWHPGFTLQQFLNGDKDALLA